MNINNALPAFNLINTIFDVLFNILFNIQCVSCKSKKKNEITETQNEWITKTTNIIISTCDDYHGNITEEHVSRWQRGCHLDWGGIGCL